MSEVKVSASENEHRERQRGYLGYLRKLGATDEAQVKRLKTKRESRVAIAMAKGLAKR